MTDEAPGSGRPVRVPRPGQDAPAPQDDHDEWLDSLAEGRGLAGDNVPPADPDAYRHAPARPIIVVGGGRVGRAIMRKFHDAVVLETDPVRVGRLRDEFGAYRVHHGSGAHADHIAAAGLAHAIAVVACTNSDETNLKIALTAKAEHVAKVIVRLEDPELAPRFTRIGAEPVAGPLNVCATMITNLLSPARRTIGEGVIAEGAPTVGVRIHDLKLPDGAIIVSFLRGDHLITPDPEERLDAGDVVTVMTEKADLGTTLAEVTGRDLALNPLDRLYVPLTSASALKSAFREAYVLAEYADAELFVVAVEGLDDVVKEAERFAAMSAIPLQVRYLPAKDFVRRFMDLVREEDRSDQHGGLREHLFFECIVVDPQTRGTWPRLLRRGLTEQLMRRLDHPLLIARNLKPYKEILLVIDNTQRASMTVAHTIDLALVYGSDITALLPESAAGEEAYRLLRHLKRTGRIYGVQVHERFVIGNPTIEYIKEVKSGRYDLIVVDWQARSVKRDILRRVMRYGPRSTLILP